MPRASYVFPIGQGGSEMQLNTIRQTATRLSVSTATIRRLVEKAALPVVRVGRCVRLREDDVEALIRRGYWGRSPDKQHGAEL